MGAGSTNLEYSTGPNNNSPGGGSNRNGDNTFHPPTTNKGNFSQGNFMDHNSMPTLHPGMGPSAAKYGMDQSSIKNAVIPALNTGDNKISSIPGFNLRLLFLLL